MLSQRVKFSSFLWPCSIPLCKCPIVVLSTHLLIDMGCCHTLTIVNNSAMNIGVLMFFQISVLGSFRYIPRSGIAGSKADPFKFLGYFELIHVRGIRSWSSYIFLHISVQFFQHHLLNKLSLAHCMCLLPLPNIN